MKKTILLNIYYNCNQLRNFLQINIIITLILFISPLTHYAQDVINIESNAVFAEKIYLQLDGKVYTTGNTVWFKSVVINANNHIPSTLSHVLYVELIAPDETIVEKKLIKIEKGVGQGFFYLDKALNEGPYLIRAYTQWNKNFETDFLFKEYINVFTAQKQEDIPPINDITLINGLNSENHLEASFNPLSLDSLHKKKLTVIITTDDNTDTLYVKKDIDKKYRIKYTIPNTCHFATLQMQTANKFNFSKTIILDDRFVDLQFFPEGGELVHGLPNKLGIKVLDVYGKGMMINGVIMDGQNSKVASFSTNSLGMGNFVLSHVDSAKTYFAKIDSQSAIDNSNLHPLPKVAMLGNILSVSRSKNNIVLTALSNYMANDSIFLQMYHRGIKYYEVKVRLGEGVFRMTIPNDKFPEGIVLFTMMDKLKRPVAERLYFNEKPEERIKISHALDKKIYQKRELTKLKVKTTNSKGKPVNANISVLVINQKQLGKMQDVKQNILSYFLLDSELKGEIESSGHYFNKDSSMHHDLDALMLTQGWRKYNYRKPFKELSFQPEQSLSVSGHVGGVFSTKKRKRAELTLLTFGKNRSIYSQITDSLGRFRFNLDNEFGQNLNILLQSAKKTGKKMNYTITLDKKESPIINFNHIKTVVKPDSVVHTFVEKDFQRNKINDVFHISSDHIALEEVTVTAYKLTPNRKKVMEQYGEPDEIIEGKAILKKEEKWSYGLYSVLLFNFPDKVRIIRLQDGNLYARLHNPEMTLVVIDGIPVQPYDYSHIPNIPPSEVSSFEIIEYAKNFSSLYCEIFPEGCPYAPTSGNVIAIYTHGKKGIYGVEKPVGIMQATVPVFSTPREFYSPKYKDIKPNDWKKPDLRALVHWEPVINTDNMGEKSISFYNADNVGKMKIIIEVISEKGEIAYQEIIYEVGGEEKEIIIID